MIIKKVVLNKFDNLNNQLKFHNQTKFSEDFEKFNDIHKETSL